MKTAERVAGDIVHDIVADGLGTGDRLPLEAAMVDKYHASRSSVREALRLLEVQGLISLKPGPGGGPVVGSVDPAHLARTSSLYFHLGGATYESVLRTQAMFEPICAQLAALNPQRVQAMERFIGAPAARTVGEYRRHDVELRAVIHRLSANPIIAMLTQAINQIVADHVQVEPDAQPLERGAPNDHATLARAVAAGESETAGRLMFKHLKAMHDHYRRTDPDLLDTLIEWR
jgi:DNA-binding FadR family transcriptional regulator